jgi:hypothetical protein
MPGSFAVVVKRWVAAVTVSALLAAGALLGAAPGSEAAAARSALDNPPRASPGAVMKALGVRDVPAEIIILVDISLSMAPEDNGLYAAVRQKLLDYLGLLAKDDQQDLVGVILFGKPSDNQLIDPGPPNPHILLPQAPYSEDTDFGWAFQQAVQMLSDAPSYIKAGGILLLSDGEPSVPPGADPVYGSGFTTQGWRKLRARVQNLPMTVTGYDVPLTDNTTFTANQLQALRQVFQPVQSLPYGVAQLGRSLSLATQGILDKEVASAAAPDAGRGVQVTWGRLSGTGGRPLDMSTGRAEVAVTLTAMTQDVPLYISGLSVTSTGLPVVMKGTLPGGHSLDPGRPVTWHVPLTWQSADSWGTRMGSPRILRGKLALAAAVTSSFIPTLRSTFGDTSFSVGGIQGGISPQFPVSQPVLFSILVAILVMVGAVLLVTGGSISTARLRGTLLLEMPKRAVPPLRLHGLRLSTSTDELIGEPGRMIVHGFPFRRTMMVHLWIDGRPRFDEPLLPGGRLFPGGVDIVHDKSTVTARPDDASAEIGEPDDKAADQTDIAEGETGEASPDRH